MNSYQLYKNRSVSDNVNMVFDFVGENWKKWLKMKVYFLLLFSVILGTTIATFLNDTAWSISELTYTMFVVLLIMGCAVATALEILLVAWCDTHDGTLDGCNMSTMWHMMPRASLKCLLLIGLSVPVLVIAFLILLIPVFGLCIISVVLPIFLTAPIMLLEPKNSLMNVFKRALSLGFKKWGALILLSMVMILVPILMNNAIIFPLSALAYYKELIDPASDSVFSFFVIDIASYVMCVAGCFVFFLEVSLFIHAITCHYGSVAADVEDIGLENDIENFAQLK